MLRSDSGLGDLTRNFGSGLGLSALSQNLRSRRHVLIAPRVQILMRVRVRVRVCNGTCHEAGLARCWSSSAMFMAATHAFAPTSHMECYASRDVQALGLPGNRTEQSGAPCSDVASVDGLSIGPGGGLSPAPSPLPNALNSFISNMQNQVQEAPVARLVLTVSSQHDGASPYGRNVYLAPCACVPCRVKFARAGARAPIQATTMLLCLMDGFLLDCCSWP